MIEFRRRNQPGGVFEELAAKYGVSVSEITREMQTVLDAAWDNLDPTIRGKQRQLFPNGKPAIDEFIRIMADQMKNKSAGQGTGRRISALFFCQNLLQNGIAFAII
jgi:hypothetical protein